MLNMRATKPILGFRNTTVPEKIRICTQSIRSIAKLPPEKRTRVPVDELETLLGETCATIRHLDYLNAQMRLALSRRNEQLGRLCTKVTEAVTMISPTRENIVAMGLGMKRYGVRSHVPRTPQKFRVLRVPGDGSVRLAWTRECRRSVFPVQVTTDLADARSWKLWEVGLGARVTLTGFQPGVRYWLRVAEQNSAGISPWSQPIQVMAL